jgi:NAD(P)-dependent dehydrogenase (short-subunit alcohol dehydrogenase family)
MASKGAVEGRVAVVTGAARGLGEALAVRLADEGMRVALLGLEPAELSATAARCGDGARAWEVDVTDAAALTAVAGEVVDHYGGVDVVVANAGIAAAGPVAAMDLADFTRVLQVNLFGSVHTARAFLPALRRSRGYFLQIASLAAMTAPPMMSAYCASKSGVESFAHALRAEEAHHGVDVGVAYLSWTDTDMVRNVDQDTALRDMRAGLPFPTNRTYPLDPAADRITAGILARRAHVYGQSWLPAMQLLRGLAPQVVTRYARRVFPEFERRWQESRP